MATDHDAFAAAILASPADDAPRLVYADRLDELGHAEAAALLRLVVGRRPLHYGAEGWAWFGAGVWRGHPADLPWEVRDLLSPGEPARYPTEADAYAALARALLSLVTSPRR